MEEMIRIGLDIGNRNLKVCSDKEKPLEIPVAYNVISKEEYENESYSNKDMYKVKYKDKYYLVGANCEYGLPKNKGDESKREQASMFKLLGLAIDLKAKDITEGTFRVVTGTPIQDYDEYKNDYLSLMLTNNEGFETIEVDKVTYRIRVDDAFISRQSLSIVPTILDWKEKDVIVFDFGGGTLDIAAVFSGAKKDYFTIDFSLNRVLEDLGNKLNSYKLGITPRPNSSDTGFIKTMEHIVLTGTYRNETSIAVNNFSSDIKSFCSEWLQSKLDEVIDNVAEKLGLSSADCKAVEVYFIGGGSKLLFEQIKKNKKFANSTIAPTPEFANVISYLVKANVKKEWK